RQGDKYKVPRIIFANKMDKIGADFFFCLDTIKQRLGVKAVPLQLPVGIEQTFKGVVDLLEMKAIIWNDESLGASFHDEPIPADMLEQAKEYRGHLVEACAEVDDAAMTKYLEGGEFSIPELKALIRKAVRASTWFPVLCGSAFKNKGVQPLLDAVVDYLPSPLEVPAIKGIHPDTEEELVRNSSDEEPLAMLAFKIMNDPFVGSLTFCRIYSGKIESGTGLQNTVKNKRERIGRMVEMHANNRQDIKEAYAGDIVAIVGLKDTTTGDTLCDPMKPVILERMEFPEPVIELAVEPKTKADQEKMGVALQRLAAEDPSFRVSTDEESGQTIIKGMGELHLDIIVDRMRREFKVEANVGAPQVAYRETITKAYSIDYTHKKQTGGTGQFARVKMRIIPGEPGSGFIFESQIVGGSIPREFIPGVEKGLISVKDAGMLVGFPILDFKVELFDGAFHDVDSSVLAFEIAARAALKEAKPNLGMAILEPIMKVEVVTPEEFTGTVIGDINSRRGQIQNQEMRGNANVVHAMVPLA
ncbi:MAG: elongation factor G, partial [Parvularculaceae bacterium]|nr:elongation factor G [Parvularculaceae bacterium]